MEGTTAITAPLTSSQKSLVLIEVLQDHPPEESSMVPLAQGLQKTSNELVLSTRGMIDKVRTAQNQLSFRPPGKLEGTAKEMWDFISDTAGRTFSTALNLVAFEYSLMRSFLELENAVMIVVSEITEGIDFDYAFPVFDKAIRGFNVQQETFSKAAAVLLGKVDESLKTAAKLLPGDKNYKEATDKLEDARRKALEAKAALVALETEWAPILLQHEQNLLHAQAELDINQRILDKAQHDAAYFDELKLKVAEEKREADAKAAATPALVFKSTKVTESHSGWFSSGSSTKEYPTLMTNPEKAAADALQAQLELTYEEAKKLEGTHQEKLEKMERKVADLRAELADKTSAQSIDQIKYEKLYNPVKHECDQRQLDYSLFQETIRKTLRDTGQLDGTIKNFLDSISGMTTDLMDTGFSAQGLDSALTALKTFMQQDFGEHKVGLDPKNLLTGPEVQNFFGEASAAVLVPLLTQIGFSTVGDFEKITIADIVQEFEGANIKLNLPQRRKVQNLLDDVNGTVTPAELETRQKNNKIRQGLQIKLLKSFGAFLKVLNPITQAVMKRELALNKKEIEYVTDLDSIPALPTPTDGLALPSTTTTTEQPETGTSTEPIVPPPGEGQ